jgi:squalene-hopene/tetraprenyl-beta-curcumene cyclase
MDGGNEAANRQRVSRRDFNAAWSSALASATAVAGSAATTLADTTSGARNGWVGGAPLARCVDRAIGYLGSRGQARDGSFGSEACVGVTSLVTAAVLLQGCGTSDPLVANALKCIERFVHPDGGIYSSDGTLANYETCLAIMCLKEANADRRYDRLIRDAEAYIRGYQWDETKDKSPDNPAYGGAGYGKRKRPDLSNTTFFVESLKACGRGADDPAIQKALVFVSRCQNLESQHNTTPMASKNPDGGFFYTCDAGGVSPAGQTPTGGLRSYASMTYSGLKSMIHAGLGPDDPRVRAAVEWIRGNYSLKSNPGMGDSGLYYYYHVFAKTFGTLGTQLFEDAAGVAHDWRRELADELLHCQREDGSWINANHRWMEGDPNLATAYAVLALSYCRPAAAGQQ